MPFLAVLAAAAEHGERKDAAALEPGKDGGAEARPLRDEEAAVAGEERGRVLVRLLPLRVHEEYGNLGAVLGSREELLGSISRGIDGNLEAEEHLHAALRDRGPVDGVGDGERLEREVSLVLVGPADEPRRGAELGERQLARELSVEVADFDAGKDVLQVHDRELPAHQAGGLQGRVLPLGNDLPP